MQQLISLSLLFNGCFCFGLSPWEWNNVDLWSQKNLCRFSFVRKFFVKVNGSDDGTIETALHHTSVGVTHSPVFSSLAGLWSQTENLWNRRQILVCYLLCWQRPCLLWEELAEESQQNHTLVNSKSILTRRVFALQLMLTLINHHEVTDDILRKWKIVRPVHLSAFPAACLTSHIELIWWYCGHW